MVAPHLRDDPRRALERLHEAQRIGQIGDWEFDLANASISWSPQVHEITGRDPADGPPASYEEMASIFEPDSADRLRRQVDQAVETGMPQSYGLVLDRPDGVRVHVLARAVTRRDEQGRVVALTGTVQDVTARDRAERLVAESEERLGFALAAAEIGDWDMDLRTDVARRSLRHDRCFGYTRPVDAWGYATFLAHVDDLDRARVDAAFTDALAGGGDYDVEFRVTWPDGSVHWLWSKGRFYFDDAGEAYRVAGIQVDVTERRREVEAALRLAAIVESSEGAQAVRLLFGLATRGEVVAPFEAELRRPDGSLVDVLLTLSPLVDVDGHVVGVSTIARDISDRKRLESSLRHQALHDTLTGLPNRALLDDRMSHALTAAHAREGTVAVLFLDLDRFKVLNDAEGHEAGDAVLVEVAARLCAAVRPQDTVARFGGDEFVVLCETSGLATAHQVAERVHECLGHPFQTQGPARFVAASIGIAIAHGDSTGADLLRDADAAMYRAKNLGRGRTAVFDADIRAWVCPVSARARRPSECALSSCLAPRSW